MEATHVGESIDRFDSLEKVTGMAKYPGDFSSNNQITMKVLFSSKPHAIIKNVDVTRAEKIPGVIAILTAKDVPNNEYGLMEKDQPVLCGLGSKKAGSDHVRCVSDQIAVVLAESEKIATQALESIHVEYVELPLITNVDTALAEDAFIIHADKKENIFAGFRIRHGELGVGKKESDIIIESTYKTPVQEHIFLQPEAGFAYFDEKGRITIIVSGQWNHEDREQVAHALGVPEDEVRIIYPAIGGAFGGREDMSVQIILGLAIKILHERGINRPVKITWSRKESIIGHHKRHPYQIHLLLGAKSTGELTFLKADIVADGGAYLYTSNKVLGNATMMVCGPYLIPHVHVDSKVVCTNNLPYGAFRGFGGPQACFAIETHINKLAEALDIDPITIRLKNTLKEGQLTAVNTPLPKGISIDKVIRECAVASGWEEKKKSWVLNKGEKKKTDTKIYRGKGFSAGFKNVGFSFGAPENCWAKIELHGKKDIDQVRMYHAGADVGQGAHSVFKQIAADQLNIPIDKINLIASDTSNSASSGSASASRLTFMSGNSILGATRKAKAKWDNGDRPAIAEYTYIPPATTPLDPNTGECMPNFAYGYVAECVDVEVDRNTGKVKLIKVICANDVGKALNPVQVRGQIEGAVVQAAGYTLLENFIQKDGFVLTDSMATYLVPTIMDIPDTTESIIIEEPDPIGPIGARGMGEMPYIPFAPAVISAVHDATGIWFDRFPLVEEEILKGWGVIE